MINIPKLAVGILYFWQIFLVNIFEPSSWDATLLGPKTFILNFSKDLPVFYGLTSVLLAIVLGVGAAIIRRAYSNWDDKRLAKLKK